MKLTDIIDMVEAKDSRLKVFSRNSPPQKAIQTVAVSYPSGRIEVYMVDKLFIKPHGIVIQGKQRIRRFKDSPNDVIDNYKEKILTPGELEKYKFFYF